MPVFDSAAAGGAPGPSGVTPSITPLPAPVSRLPKVGTTIFTVVSALAAEHGAVNLGQGFPDFDCDPRLLDEVDAAMRAGHNQYPPMTGWPALRQAISRTIAQGYGSVYDPDREITVTAGATQAILTALLALVHPGDEVIVIEPAYDCYVPAITMAGAVPVFVPMTPPSDRQPTYTVPWDRVRQAVGPRTRMILVNSPHNPTSSVFDADDLLALQQIACDHGLLVLSDEVYEHMVFDGARHESVARYPALAERSVIVSSFGKTFHVTGWKVGYLAAPAALTVELRKVHQYMVFTVNTPMQAALARYLDDPTPWRTLSAFYQRKRDLFGAGLARTRFEPLPSQGTYFQLARYRRLADRCGELDEADFCRWLTTEVGVAAIPVSAFYDQPRESGIVRFCFAKRDETLERALRLLQAL
ncbi:MAG: pyridoxal phosphate-dependent aminotransferase [Burkholderiaceae bacterium]